MSLNMNNTDPRWEMKNAWIVHIKKKNPHRKQDAKFSKAVTENVWKCSYFFFIILITSEIIMVAFQSKLTFSLKIRQ